MIRKIVSFAIQTTLTLFLLPTLYLAFESRREESGAPVK
jgi:hypothetical protein